MNNVPFSGGRAAAAALALAVVCLGACREPPAAPSEPQLPAPSLAEDLREAALKADSFPPGAALWVDGADTGKLTPAEVKLDTGRDHEIELRRDGYLTFQKKVFAAPHETIELKPALTAGVRLEVVTEPGGAVISVDGEELATSPGPTPALAQGKHLVRIAAPGYVAVEREVLVVLEDAKTHKLNVKLQRGREVRVTSTPEGASIIVDGKDTGLATPASLVIAPGPRRAIAVEKTSYARAEHVLHKVKAGDETVPVDFTLEKGSVVGVNKKIGALEAKIEQLQGRLEKLQKKEEGGFFLEGKTAQQAYDVEKQVLDVEKQLDDLGFQLSELREEREKLLAESEPAAP